MLTELGFIDPPPACWPEAGQQRLGAPPEHGMRPAGRHLQQGHQDEGAPVQQGVRQDKAAALAPSSGTRPAQAPATEVQDVQVQRTWLQWRSRMASGALLKALQESQKTSWTDTAFGNDDRIQIARLTAAADGGSLIEV